MDEVAHSTVRAQLAISLDTIRARLAAFELRPHHLVPDFVLYCYATDVLEHCRATMLLADSEVPRAAYACARAATEAAQDLALLVSSADDYDAVGARAYVWDLLETMQLQQRFVRGRTEMGIPVPPDLGMSVDQAIAAVAAKWGRANSRAEPILRTALAELRGRKRPPSHWSGLSRHGIVQRILEGSPYGGSAAAMDAMYGALSAQTHPRVREWGRKFRFISGLVSLSENPDDRERPVDAAWAAAYASWLMLELAMNQLYLP